MRSIQRFTIGLCLVLVAATRAVAAEEGQDTASWLRFVATELRQLRMEALEDQISTEADRVSQIEQALAMLRIEQAEARNEERAHLQQLADFDRQLKDPGSDPQSGAHIQAMRAELANTGAEQLRAKHSALAAREAALSERLRITRARLEALTDRLKKLSTQAR